MEIEQASQRCDAKTGKIRQKRKQAFLTEIGTVHGKILRH
jgi:hypothetical protein